MKGGQRTTLTAPAPHGHYYRHADGTCITMMAPVLYWWHQYPTHGICNTLMAPAPYSMHLPHINGTCTTDDTCTMLMTGAILMALAPHLWHLHYIRHIAHN